MSPLGGGTSLSRGPITVSDQPVSRGLPCCALAAAQAYEGRVTRVLLVGASVKGATVPRAVLQEPPGLWGVSGACGAGSQPVQEGQSYTPGWRQRSEGDWPGLSVVKGGCEARA